MASAASNPGGASWVILDLRVHAGWSVHDNPTTHDAWHGLRDALEASRHRLISWSNSGEQALLYVVTDDVDALLDLARGRAPSAGTESFVAKIWDRDPRDSGTAPREILLAGPHPLWPNPYHGVEQLERSLDEIARGPGVSPN
ncbi:hypothetical protein [Solirubrobacter soli]|uniref:hypothetical protein n=1 Tax=Solirubrobacter soli TaxID=363832 RepID=UPI0012FC3B5C|nr:hypothetical protein [Solirubrobacter soli]